MYKYLLQGHSMGQQVGEKEEKSNREGIIIQKDERVRDPDHTGGINLPSEKVILFLVREKEDVQDPNITSTLWET